MKEATLDINFREPNVDRFFEIIRAGVKLGYSFKVHVLNMPKGYESFIKRLFLEYKLFSFEECDFCIEYPKKINFNRCFEEFESIKTIKDRADSVKAIDNKSMDSSGKALLKHACEKLELNKDQLQSIMHLSYVIACLDSGKQIEAHHTAEAIMYIKKQIEQ